MYGRFLLRMSHVLHFVLRAFLHVEPFYKLKPFFNVDGSTKVIPMGLDVLSFLLELDRLYGALTHCLVLELECFTTVCSNNTGSVAPVCSDGSSFVRCTLQGHFFLPVWVLRHQIESREWRPQPAA